MLLDGSSRKVLEEKMKQIVHLSIAEAPDFQSRFIENTILSE
jgi:hypothetical protein